MGGEVTEELSFTNRRVQRLRRLIGRRSARTEERRFVLHGAVLIREAIDAGFVPELEFVAPHGDPMSGGPAVRLAEGVIERIADTVSPQPNIAIFEQPAHTDALATAELVVVLDRINDPGNLGTILRSCEAAGVDAIMVTPGSVDPFHPKAIRASAGAVLLVPVATGDLDDERLRAFRRLGTSSHLGEPHTMTDLTGRLAIVMGSEAHGLPSEAPIDAWTRIVHVGRSESLNVAMATTLLVFEAARQRSSSSQPA